MDELERDRLSRISKDALNCWLEGDYRKAHENWIILSNSRDSFYKNEALIFLADQYSNGIGVKQDYGHALYLLKKVVPDELGKLLRSREDYHLGQALYLMGCILEKERAGSAFDVVKAIRLLKEASKVGSSNAAYKLGCYYRTGTLVKKDFRLALRYLKIAARRGHDEASKALRDLRENGRLGLIWRLAGRFAKSSNE